VAGHRIHNVPYPERSIFTCPIAEKDVTIVINWLPHRMGIEDPNGFKCSGQSECGVEVRRGDATDFKWEICPHDYPQGRLVRRRWR